MASASFLTLLLADGRLPTGAHTQSAGLEPALRHGMRLADLPGYLIARLRTVTEVEAAAAVLTRHRWLTNRAQPEPERSRCLAEVDRAWRVRTLSDATRAASDLLARSYRRLAERVFDLDLDPGHAYCRPVVLGAVAAAGGLDAPALARLVGYEDVQTVVAAALKLEPFDPHEGVRWVVAAGDEVEQMVTRVAGVTRVSELPAHAAPQMEQWAQWHQTAERRLYRA